IEVHRLGTAPYEVRFNGRNLRGSVAAFEQIPPGSAYVYDPARSLLRVVALCSSDSAYTLSVSCPATR
ncbi:MAG TPA: hypothetical protein VMF59_06210, partial [Bacteroidota bacterium]|nr:hypothetical protein [Bacteroidota bacterium]